ncbi:MAG TPA: hypothetical protein VKE30_00195 [Chthoniobacterales bacterium]|nr:hypothetical protein [Chthoniobacterales bacterium]
MQELSADEAEVYRLAEKASAEYQRYISTTELVTLPSDQSFTEDIGNYDWRHAITICTDV